MKRLLVAALLLAPLLGIVAAGRASADEKDWSLTSNTRIADCAYCHGEKGEGGLGPDLAGRNITLDQFKQAVRKPWGMMPAYPTATDEKIAGVYSYMQSLPKVAQPAPWRVPVPPENAPHAQRLLVTYGCAMCHGPEMIRPRTTLGGLGATTDDFQKIVWNHLEMYPRNMMGQFSKDRLPEAAVKEIAEFTQALGYRAQIAANVAAGTPADGNTTYTVTVLNNGKAGKGIAAGDITVSLALPAGAKVVSTTGAGYVGVQHDAQKNVDMAVWKLANLEAAAKQTYSVTLPGTAPATAVAMGSVVSWMKPEFKTLPGQIQDPSDEKRIPGFGKAMDKGDAIAISVARPPAPTQ